jgi:hypothetical protein
MAAAFKEVWPEQGVDDEDTKPKMMVPLHKSNYVLLTDGSGLTVPPDRKGFIEVKEIKTNVGSTVTGMAANALGQRSDPTQNFFGELITDIAAPFVYGALASNARLFRVKGNKGGLTSIEASGRGGKAELVVTVHPQKLVKVAFHFAATTDGSGKIQPLTRWNPSDTSQWIIDLNHMYTPQANVVFEKIHADYWVPQKKDPKNPSSLTPWDPKVPFSLATWDTVTVKRLPKVLNIYLVGKWIGNGSDPLGSHIIATKDVVCDDTTDHSSILMLLSHEIGHFLGAGHPPVGKRHWITEMSFARTGNKIPHDFVLLFNPW